MGHVRFTILTITLFSLTAQLLAADDKPAAKEPLQILADCLQAAESGDFARYVDHLSSDEQTLQAGYVLFMTRNTSRANELGAPINDPELFLLAKTMDDLVQQHMVPAGERNAEHHAAEKLLARLTGETPGESPGYPNYPSRPMQYGYPANPEMWKTVVGVLKDPRDFLIAALGEIARPTSIEGGGDSKPNTVVFVDEFIKTAKALKWTMYTRGDYAVAISNLSNQEMPVFPYAPAVAAGPRTHVEFKRIDGVWKITRLLPASAVFLGNRLATH